MKRCNAKQLTKKQLAVAADLLEALRDGEMTDVFLTSSDGTTQVPASRFVLAARSPMLKRMLYGGFREAKSSTICMMGYDRALLEAVVYYCSYDELQESWLSCSSESNMRCMVQLQQAADYLQLPGLVRMTDSLIRKFISGHPPWACTVFDEAVEGSPLAQYAVQVIENRPYVALDCSRGDEGRGGGITSLSPDKLQAVVENSYVGAGELFLFRMLKRWFEHQADDGATECTVAEQVARRCARGIRFQNIEPRQLLSDEVQGCPFVTSEQIFEAVAKQALKASLHKKWSLHFRGSKDSAERVLVEGAGCPDVNGMYYRIAAGLQQGDLFSKREVSCGQSLVYTLSRTVSSKALSKHMAVYECRIFCTPFLTKKAVRGLQTVQSPESVQPVFQPVLQVIELEPPNPTGNVTMRKFHRVRVSDGEYHMPGTLAKDLNPMIEAQELREYCVVKVQEFGLYTTGGRVGIHIIKATIVTNSPTHQFRDPVDVKTLQTEEGITSETEQKDNGLQNLYTCTCRVDNNDGFDDKIPKTGWEVHDHGVAPAPLCTWIPSPPLSKQDSLDASARSIASTMEAASPRSVSSRRSSSTPRQGSPAKSIDASLTM
jgi:hypothetical protein